MDRHAKVRLDILIEAPFSRRLSALLDGCGVSGYTIFSAMGGKGSESAWRRDGAIIDVGGMQLFICIMDEERRDAVLEALQESLAAHIGFVTTSRVEVIRPAKFP